MKSVNKNSHLKTGKTVKRCLECFLFAEESRILNSSKGGDPNEALSAATDTIGQERRWGSTLRRKNSEPTSESRQKHRFSFEKTASG